MELSRLRYVNTRWHRRHLVQSRGTLEGGHKFIFLSLVWAHQSHHVPGPNTCNQGPSATTTQVPRENRIVAGKTLLVKVKMFAPGQSNSDWHLLEEQYGSLLAASLQGRPNGRWDNDDAVATRGHVDANWATPATYRNDPIATNQWCWNTHHND